MGMLGAKILVVDDVAENIDILNAILKAENYQLIAATSGERALKLIEKNKPDLILLDVMMPGDNGFDICKAIKRNPDTSDIPIIFVTARADDVSTGFGVGGSDYIPKPINADEVRTRVRYQLERKELLLALQRNNDNLEVQVRERTAELTLTNKQLRQEIKERRYMQDRLNYLASHDFITHLQNRGSLEIHIAEVLAKVQIDFVSSVFLLIDIDQFRLINESCGCIAGDELLRDFASLVSSHLSNGDFFARLGGDKFAIVTATARDDYGTVVANRIKRQIDNYIFTWEGYEFPVKASISTVELNKNIISFDQLMLMADEIAYLAKQEGGNAVYVYEESLNSMRSNRKGVNWALKLIDGLKNANFRLYFQRIEAMDPRLVNLKSANIRIEVLVRLWDPDAQRIIFPEEFIPQAERFHIIADIDRWVIRETMKFLSDNSEVYQLLDKVNLNLSAITIGDVDLADYIHQLLLQYNVPAQMICFEITETEAITNRDLANEFMRKIQGFGCSFILDDFGSGYASFNYLIDMSFDMLKIDGVFVRDMDKRNSHRVMVKSMYDVAKQLGKPIVAEFIETKEVFDMVRDIGITWGQGFLMHRPEALTYSALCDLKKVTKKA